MWKGLIILLIVSCFAVFNNTREDKQFKRFENYKVTQIEDQIIKHDTLLWRKFDSIKIVCSFLGTNSKSVIFKISENKLTWSYQHKDDKIYTITSKERRVKLVDYLDRFYVDSEQIIIKKTKRNFYVSDDYPIIHVQGKKDEKIILNSKTQIGEEHYDVVYNPVFLEFYDFLSSLLNDQ